MNTTIDFDSFLSRWHNLNVDLYKLYQGFDNPQTEDIIPFHKLQKELRKSKSAIDGISKLITPRETIDIELKNKKKGVLSDIEITFQHIKDRVIV